jgi:hypothetical protein
VRTRRDGRLVFYALDDQHIVGLFEQGLEHVEERAGGAATPPGRRLLAGTEVPSGDGGPRRGPRSRS